jgi:hypothetical protein
MTARRVGRGVTAAACLLVPAAAGEIAAQCAMCGTAMGSRGGFARGFTISVIFLLSTLTLVVAGFVRLVLARTLGRDPLSAAPDPRRLPARPAEADGGRWLLLLRRVFFL